MKQFISNYSNCCLRDNLVLIHDSDQILLETVTSGMDYSNQDFYPPTRMEFQAAPLVQNTNYASEYWNRHLAEIEGFNTLSYNKSSDNRTNVDTLKSAAGL